MSAEPYSKARRVFVIVDNGSAHRGKKSIKRLQGRYKNLILVHTPVHASWLNQAEIYFSIVQRKVLTPNDFSDLETPQAATARVRPPLRADSPTVRVEVHPRRPRPPRPATRPTCHQSSLTHQHVGELPSQST
jgi:DDE superfamily endonuclease